MLRGMEIHSMIGSAAGHRTHLEHLQLHAFATQDRPDFVPVHLPFRPPLVGLWHEHFAVLQSQLLRATLHVAAHRTLAPVEADNFRTQPVEDAAGRVALLRWRRKIRSQYLIDEIGNRVRLRSRRCWGLGAAGSTLHSASRTIRRCTPNFRDTPAIVPTPNSYSGESVRKLPPCPSWLASYASVAPSTKRSQHPHRWAKVNCHSWAKPECQNQLVPFKTVIESGHDILMSQQ